jgi:predicted transposase/invertase (TIGR01784 family)
MHLIELPKFKRTAEELVDPLDVWCYFLTHGAELDTENLAKALRTPAVHQAMGALKMLTQDDLERERYEARLKGERDRSYFAKYATYAREEGIEQGRQEGLQLGLEGRIHFCQRLLGIPVTPGEQLLALSVDELEAIVADLEKQAMSRS